MRTTYNYVRNAYNMLMQSLQFLRPIQVCLRMFNEPFTHKTRIYCGRITQTRGRYENEFVWRIKSLWIEASLMRIYYLKHVSGALNLYEIFFKKVKSCNPYILLL